MKYVTVNDKDAGPCAFMPLWVWNMTGRLCKDKGPLGILGGFIINGYKFYYKDNPKKRTAFIMWESIRLWWGCRHAWELI